MDYEKLGDNIRNYREQRGFTQEKLTELSNISEKHLSKIERGKINIKTVEFTVILWSFLTFCNNEINSI